MSQKLEAPELVSRRTCLQESACVAALMVLPVAPAAAVPAQHKSGRPIVQHFHGEIIAWEWTSGEGSCTRLPNTITVPSDLVVALPGDAVIVTLVNGEQARGRITEIRPR